jgi:hypothetical protein
MKHIMHKSVNMTYEDKKQPATADGFAKKKCGNRRNKRHGNKPTVQPATFQGGKDELDGNYFDCTGYWKSDRLMKTVQKVADHIRKEYKGGGVTRTEVMTQTAVIVPMPSRPVSKSVVESNGTIKVVAPDALNIIDYQKAKNILDYQSQNLADNHQKVFSLVW